MWILLLSCWAPEMAPPTPSPSPVERSVPDKPPAQIVRTQVPANEPSPQMAMLFDALEGSNEDETNDSNPSVLMTDDQDAHQDTVHQDTVHQDSGEADGIQQALEDSMVNEDTDELTLSEADFQEYIPPSPPFTTWTTESNISLHGPRGGVILNVERMGVRIEVLSVVDDWAQIICSGCAPPAQNQAGWVPASAIQHPDEIDTSSPLGRILSYRRDWAKGEAHSEEINNIDLCMLVDAGFEIQDALAQWHYREGQISLDISQPESAPQITPPTEHQELGWRCAIERGYHGKPL